MGAEFSKELKRGDTLVVVACSKTPKTEKAHEWGVEIVNHLWLEDCYAEWRMVPFTNSRYTHSFLSDQLQLAICSRALENITFEGELKELGLSPSKERKKPTTGRVQPSPGGVLADVKIYKRVGTSSFQEQEEVEAVVGGIDLDMELDEDVTGPDLPTPALRRDTAAARASSSTVKPSSPTKATAAKPHQQPIEAVSPLRPTRQPHPVEEPVYDDLSPAPVPKKRKKLSLEGKSVTSTFADKPQSKSRRYDPTNEDDALLSLGQLRSMTLSSKPTREVKVDDDKPVKIKGLGKLKEQIQAVEKEDAQKDESEERGDTDEDETSVVSSPVTKPTKPPRPAPQSKQVPYPAEAGDSCSRLATKAAAKNKGPLYEDRNLEYWYGEPKAKPPKSKEERQKEKETPELDGGRTKRGAASKLKSDMEDRNWFEREIKHEQVMGSWEGKSSLYKRERDPELDDILDQRPPKKRKSMPESGEESSVESFVIFKRCVSRQ